MTTLLATFVEQALGPDYRLEHELEGGGMSRVFMATDLRHDRRVVVKVLSPELVSPTSIARFKQEIDMTVHLQHPHILPVLTSGASGDVLYYIAPFIEGESLRARIARDGRLPLDAVVRILRDASDALVFAHAHHIIHRDVKPGNILLAEGHAILADFGIARAMLEQSPPLTASGLMVGTPAYMAPELPTDHSADVFALGVVAYEMLCGSLPTRGVTAKAICDARRDIPNDSRYRLTALADLVARTLSSSIASRPATAADFLSQLEDLQPRHSSRRALVSAAAALAVAAAVLGWSFVVKPRALDPAKYYLASVNAPDSLSRETRALLARGFGEWKGLTVVDDRQHSAESSRQPPGLDAALKIGRGLGARNVVDFKSDRRGDSIEVSADLYDVTGDSVVRRSRAVMSATPADAGRIMAVRRLINGVVRSGEELPWTFAADAWSASLPAWNAYDSGRAAIRAWNLRDAERAFHNATIADPDLSLAQLWLAQTLAWSDTGRRVEGRAAAARSLSKRSGFSARDSSHASGLLALFSSDYPGACRSFQTLASRDSTDFAAWLGLGDCQARDRTIVPDRRTRTGWIFRSSYENAARAYRRAAAGADPSTGSVFRGWILGRLSSVLYSTTNHVRSGEFVSTDTIFMGAFPYLDGDSAAFAPHPLSEFRTRKGDPPPSLVQAAATRARNDLRAYAEDWVRSAPRDPAAFDSLATWSELSGGFASVNGRQTPTLELLRAARNLATDSTEQLRLAISEVRILLKEGAFTRAREKDDSLLRTGALSRYRDVPGIAGLTALLGRVHETGRLLPLAPVEHGVRLTDGSIWSPPRPLEEAAASLLTYAVFGAFHDSVRTIARRTCQLVASYVPDSSRANAIRSVLVAGAFGYGDPSEAIVPGFEFEPPDEVVRAVLLLSHGDTAGARGQLRRLKDIDRGKLPGNGLRLAFRTATTWLALRDTVEAVRQLDDMLQTLPLLDRAFLNEVSNVASVVRAFALRARLAERLGDTPVAKANASAVVALWENADTELQPLVASMKRIVSSRH